MIISRACNCDCNNFKTSAFEVTAFNVVKIKRLMTSNSFVIKFTIFLNVEKLDAYWLKLNLETRKLYFQIIHINFQ